MRLHRGVGRSRQKFPIQPTWLFSVTKVLPNKTRPKQITQNVDNGAADRHHLYQDSTANMAIPPAAQIAALAGTKGAAVESKVRLTTRMASSLRALLLPSCL